MDQVKVDVQALHLEHTLWTNELTFFAEQIAIFEKGLGELVKKDTDREAMAELEQIQNQFIRHKEVLDELKHDIHLHEQAMSNYLKDHENASTYDDHAGMRDRMESFRKLYYELKSQFTRFMTKWM